MDAFPTPDSTFRKLAESTIAGPLRRKLLLSLLNRLGIIDSAEAARRRMMALAERGLDPFDLRSIPVGPSGAIFPEFSFSILFEKTGDPPAQRAAKLAHAALRYRQSLLDNSLEIERSGGTIIDNSRNHNLFGRVANLRKTGLRLNKQLKDCKHSSHIVVAVDGAFYKLDVIDAGGAILAADSIFRQINSMLHAPAKNEAPARAYGAITANVVRPSVDIFFADRLDESIRIIDEAIFLLAIDSIKSPADENEAAQDLHIRNYPNRDYRKSLQLVVLKNGFSGATFNHFAGIEGMAATRFASWLSSYASEMPQMSAEGVHESLFRLEFKTIDFSKLPVAKLEKMISSRVCGLPPIKRVDAIGKDGIKQLNVSPDAFFHAAAHLAYYDSFKRIPSIHNFADMRAIRFGSITRYPSTSDELVAFLENQTKPALLDAFEAHKRTIRVIKSGDNPLHYALIYLYKSAGLKPELGMALLALFVPGFIRKHLSPDIWASSIPVLPGIYCVGRFGTLFRAARKNCLAGHYLLFPDHVRICFLSHETTFLESWQFDQALNQAMRKLKRILS